MRRGRVTTYNPLWRDGKLVGAAVVALKLPFLFPLTYHDANAYDFSRYLSTIAYARPGGHADLDLLSQMLAETGVASVKLPPRSPNLNAHPVRFVRTIKEACLERMILFGEGAVRKATAEFIGHYHSERNHQGLHNTLTVLTLGMRSPPAKCIGANVLVGC